MMSSVAPRSISPVGDWSQADTDNCNRNGSFDWLVISSRALDDLPDRMILRGDTLNVLVLPSSMLKKDRTSAVATINPTGLRTWAEPRSSRSQ